MVITPRVWAGPRPQGRGGAASRSDGVAVGAGCDAGDLAVKPGDLGARAGLDVLAQDPALFGARHGHLPVGGTGNGRHRLAGSQVAQQEGLEVTTWNNAARVCGFGSIRKA
jgi:hypothetical protein